MAPPKYAVAQRNLLLSQIFTAVFRFEKSGISFGYLVGKVLVW